MDKFTYADGINALTLYDKKLKIENEILELDQSKAPHIQRKQEIETELAEINHRIRGSRLPNDEYSQLGKRQTFLKHEKMQVEKALALIKEKTRAKQSEKEYYQLQIKRLPHQHAKQALLDLKDKYIAFSADSTRVSSMRAMSSKFVEEIQVVLKFFAD